MSDLQSSKPQITKKLVRRLKKRIVEQYKQKYGDSLSNLGQHHVYPSAPGGDIDYYGKEYFYRIAPDSAVSNVLFECMTELECEGYLIKKESQASTPYFLLTQKALLHSSLFNLANDAIQSKAGITSLIAIIISIIALFVAA